MLPSKQRFSALKKYLFGFAILVYLAGTFHHEIFEGLHILSHHLTDGYTPHSHHADDIADHEHKLLEMVETALVENKNTPVTQKEQPQFSFEKIKYQNNLNAFSIITQTIEKEKIPSFNQQLPTSPFLKIIPPPPKFCV